MRVATSLNLCFGRLPEEHVIPRLAAAGFEGIDFNFNDQIDRLDWFDRQAVDDWLGRLERAAEQNNLPWVQAHGPLFDPGAGTAYAERARALCIPAIHACGRLGVPWMVLHPYISREPLDADGARSLRDRNVAYFRELLDECEQANVGIAVENLRVTGAEPGWRVGCGAEDLCELIDALDHPLVGACWDTGHAKLMDLDQRAALTMLGPRLKALHIQENDGQADDHMLPFCNGPKGVDWNGVTQGLRAAGYTGPFTYEAHNSFRAVPDDLFDATLQHSVLIARHLVACCEGSAAAHATPVS